MSSNDHKKFKTDATQKTSTDTEVISDTIVLPPYSTDHVITVTAPSATSGLSGQVDVEVEMSPDGENWCPVKTEEATTEGGTSGVSAINANLKAISTTPTTADPYRNKFALGSLSYDSNGVQLTTEDSGTQDFMQTFMSKDKPFNYSLWMKTDTTEQAFADDYTPVLFRHGGKDKFTNEKTVKLDESTTTTYNVTVSNPGSGNLYYIDGVSSATAIDLTEGNTYIFDQSDSSNSGHPLRFSTTSNGSHGGGTEYTTGVTVVGTPGTSGAYTEIVVDTSAPTLYYYCTNHSGMGGQLNTLSSTGITNTKYVRTPSNTPAEGMYSQTTFTNNKGWFPTYDDSTRSGGTVHWWTQTDSAISFWHRGDKTQSTHQIIMYQFYHDHGAPFNSVSDTWEGQFYIYFLDGKLYVQRANRDYQRGGSWGGGGWKSFEVGNANSTDWHHYVINIPQNASLYTAITNSTLSINAGNTTVGATATQAGTYDPDSAALTVVNAGILPRLPGTNITPANWSNVGTTQYTADIDELSTWRKSLTSQEISEIYNLGNPYDVTTSSCSSYLERHIRCGDETGDGASLYDSVSGTAFLDSHNGTDVTSTLTSSDSIFAAATPSATQNLSQNISFSNIKACQGRLGPGSSYQARIGDPYSDWSYCIWYTPYRGENNEIVNPQHQGIAYYSGIRWYFNCSSYLGGNNSRIQVTCGYYGLGISSGSVPGLYGSGSSVIAYPFGAASAGNQPEVQNSSFFVVCTNEHDSVTGSTNLKVKAYRSDGGRILNLSYTFTPTTSMSSTPNFIDHPDEHIAYDIALNDAQIEAHFQDHPSVYAMTSSGNRSTTLKAISPVDPSTLSTYSNAILHIRGGDAAGDTEGATTGSLTNLVGANTHFPASIPRYVDSQGNISSVSFYDNEPGKGNYLTSSDSQNIFNTSTPLSISGWFKTVDTGVLFSNTGGAAATGMKMEVNGSDMTLSLLNASQSISVSSDVNDGNWHHMVMTKPSGTSPTFKVYIDGAEITSTQATNISDDDLLGDNGFTLLGDGQNNINATSVSDTDSTKLSASLSNWSLHKEILDAPTVKEIYSNGHVRNLKNLVGVDASLIDAWWSLSDLTSPGQDLIGDKDLLLVDKGVTDTLNGKAIKASTLTSLATQGTKDFEVVGNKNPFADDNNMPNLDDAFTISFWLNIPTQGSTWDAILGFSATDTRNHFKLHNIGTNLSFSFAGAGEGADYTIDYSGKFNAWHHVVMIKPQSTVQNLEVFVDGIRYAITQTYNTNNYLDPATSSWGVPGTSTAQTISEFFLFGNGRAYNSSSSGVYGSNRTGRVFMIDELATYAGVLTHNTSTAGQAATGQVYQIWNNGSYVDLSTLSGLNLAKYFKFGDHSSDVNSGTLKYFDVVNDTAYFGEVNNTNGGTHTLAGTESFYKLAPANLVNNLVTATNGTLIVEEDQYGSGITMSLTKRFDPTNYTWTNTHTHPTCVCLSFNGFEDQAEFFAIYKSDTIDVADNNWHNVALSFSGKEGSSTNSTTNFSFGASNHNFVLSIDGNVINDAVYVGGLRGVPVNKTFTAEVRHLRWDSSNSQEEDYMPHCQLNSNIFESINQTTQKYEPVVDKNYKTAFIGYADDSSFHSESWFVDANGNPQNAFNDQKVATLYGSTTTPTNRGPGTDFPPGTPYPLRRPSVIGTTQSSTGNQYLDPEKYDASTNPDGGLEAWWRWGDTAGDCTENINDSIGFESEPLDAHRSLKARNYVSTLEDPDGSGPQVAIPKDLFYLTTSDSIYVAVGIVGSATISLVDAVIENIQAGVCNLKNLTSPILQYIRVKFTNSGEAQLGKDKVEASIHYRKRRER